MDEKITLTSEMMERARDYVPLAEKEAWCAENAPRVFDKLAITADGETMPPMYMVNAGLKSRYLMGALTKLYFGVETTQSFAVTAPVKDAEGDGKDEWLMSEADYDRWAGSHVFNQLERMKRDAWHKIKAFDLLADYRDLEKRFSTQISGLLAVQNDPVIRQNELSTAVVKELPQIMQALRELQVVKQGGDGDGDSSG